MTSLHLGSTFHTGQSHKKAKLLNNGKVPEETNDEKLRAEIDELNKSSMVDLWYKFI